MFLIGNISGNQIIALEFHKLKWLLIYGSKHGKYWFSHIFHCNFTTMVSTEVRLWFLSSLEHFWPDPQETLSEVALLFEKMHKVFKNKAQNVGMPCSQFIMKCLTSCHKSQTKLNTFKVSSGQCTSNIQILAFPRKMCNNIWWAK